MDPFIGQIQAFGFNFEPRGWMFCNGQLISIAQNSALFSLLGTTYGGDGITTFALPDLRSRVSIHQGQGPGLSNYALGESAGTEQITLLSSNLPTHSHSAVMKITSNQATTGNGSNSFLGGAAIYDAEDVEATLNPAAITVGNAGANMPHDNMQPYLTVNYCIAIYGIYPPRN
jgi:microcystin-dependent protein